MTLTLLYIIFITSIIATVIFAYFVCYYTDMNANGGIEIEGCLQWLCAVKHRSFPHDLGIVVHNINYKYHSNHRFGMSCLLLNRYEC